MNSAARRGSLLRRLSELEQHQPQSLDCRKGLASAADSATIEAASGMGRTCPGHCHDTARVGIAPAQRPPRPPG
jgi:hypothetical protein